MNFGLNFCCYGLGVFGVAVFLAVAGLVGIPFGEEIFCEFAVVFGAGAGGVVIEDGLAEAGAFCEFDVAADGWVEDAAMTPG